MSTNRAGRPPSSRQPDLWANSGVDGERQQHLLLKALETGEITKVRQRIADIPEDVKRKVFLTPSERVEHKLRTPLQAAAVTGDMSIYGAVLNAFDSLFPSDAKGRFKGSSRKWEMKRQLERVDNADMNLLMHAAGSGSSAVFRAVANEILQSQVRFLLRERDEKGMTFLMHAVNAGSDDTRTATTTAKEPTNEVSSTTPPTTPDPPAPGQQPDETNVPPTPDRLNTEVVHLDPWVPVISSVLEFAKKVMWKADYRQLLGARDAWKRSILEHAVASGRQQVFQTVFDAIREDIHDEKMAYMMDSGVESSHEQNPISAALQSTGGRKISHLVSEKSKGLEKDVSLRAEASTVASKIQSFIPANLIVIFQLLLPEFNEESDQPFYLLLVLCFIAPFWAWGTDMSATKGPDRKNTTARRTAARYFLAVPATFFWGVGTSKIGRNSLNWTDSVSATAMAVATIIIPAVDSFFSGPAARATDSVLTIAMLDLWDWLKTKCSWFSGSQVRRI